MPAKRRFQRNNDWCPECGHLMARNTWNCPFCGWSPENVQMHDFGIDFRDDYSDIRNPSSIDSDIDRLIDNS